MRRAMVKPESHLIVRGWTVAPAISTQGHLSAWPLPVRRPTFRKAHECRVSHHGAPLATHLYSFLTDLKLPNITSSEAINLLRVLP